jgi:hypothetical protein
MCDNRVLRIFGLNSDEIREGCRKLHNKELHFITFTLRINIIRMIKPWRLRLARQAARMGARRNACGVLVGKPEEKRPLGIPRPRCEYNTEIDLGEIG